MFLSLITTEERSDDVVRDDNNIVTHLPDEDCFYLCFFLFFFVSVFIKHDDGTN